ncbi:MAG: hypothetical protein GY930_15290 [bacterium]|nr:hypothetical protein [bacterium]
MKALFASIGVGALVLLPAPLRAQESTRSPELPAGLSQSDWNEIRAVLEVERHKAIETETGFEAHSPGQGWLTRWDGRGFLVQPSQGAWAWGLQLESYGYEGAMQSVDEVACASAEGGRVAYEWDANVQEWYVNGARGLEHGYTIRSRPALGADILSPLTVEIGVRGSLNPIIKANGAAVNFVDPSGATVVNYAGLHVYDANGVSQEAQLVSAGHLLQIQVQDSEARYPLTIDPLAQQAYLKASNPGSADLFGQSVAISGGLVVVGAYWEDSNAMGVDGNQSDNSAFDSGAAYVFERTGGVWSQQAYLKASNTDFDDAFGRSVAISGELIAVGAPFEASNSTGVNGDQSNNSAQSAGAVYIFERNGGAWSQQAYLKASNTDSDDWFGESLAFSGELLVVGAPREDSNATGVDGDQSDNSAADSGAVFLFERSGGVWSQQAYLKASNTDPNDRFGTSAAASGESVIVGAHWEESDATGVDGDQSSNSAIRSGAAYVFERSGGAWSQQAYLKASNTDPNDQFGWSVAISGELVVVGASFEDSDATGVNGNQSSNAAQSAGAAYVFERNGGIWTQQAYLKASNAEQGDYFGTSAAIQGELVVLGATFENSDAMGVNGDQSNNLASIAGAIYLFERGGGVWTQQAYLKASNAGQGDLLGRAVSLSGDLLVVGAIGEASNATGVNGDQSNNSLPDAGAAYIFDLGVPFANFCGPAVPNSTGFPGVMDVPGSLVVTDNAFSLRAQSLPAGVFGFFLGSMGHDFVVLVGGSQGTLCLGAGFGVERLRSSVSLSSASGVIVDALDLTTFPYASAPVAPGDTWNFQCWYRDRNPNSTSNFTDAISVQFE